MRGRATAAASGFDGYNSGAISSSASRLIKLSQRDFMTNRIQNFLRRRNLIVHHAGHRLMKQLQPHRSRHRHTGCGEPNDLRRAPRWTSTGRPESRNAVVASCCWRSLKDATRKRTFGTRSRTSGAAAMKGGRFSRTSCRREPGKMATTRPGLRCCSATKSSSRRCWASSSK